MHSEFVPILMDVIAVDKSAQAAARHALELVEGVRENMHEFLLYGIPKQELEAIISRAFQEADKDNSGSLDKNVRSPASFNSFRMSRACFPERPWPSTMSKNKHLPYPASNAVRIFWDNFVGKPLLQGMMV